MRLGSVFFGLLFFAIIHPTLSQDKEKEEPEINYIWIDTMINQEGQEIRLVSNDLVEITGVLRLSLWLEYLSEIVWHSNLTCRSLVNYCTWLRKSQTRQK